MWKTGHSHIKHKLHEEKADLAGEMSGHIFFVENYYGFDDDDEEFDIFISPSAPSLNDNQNDTKEENEKTKQSAPVDTEDEWCVICQENHKDTYLFPCHHMTVCHIIDNHLFMSGIHAASAELQSCVPGANSFFKPPIGSQYPQIVLMSERIGIILIKLFQK